MYVCIIPMSVCMERMHGKWFLSLQREETKKKPREASRGIQICSSPWSR